MRNHDLDDFDTTSDEESSRSYVNLDSESASLEEKEESKETESPSSPASDAASGETIESSEDFFNDSTED